MYKDLTKLRDQIVTKQSELSILTSRVENVLLSLDYSRETKPNLNMLKQQVTSFKKDMKELKQNIITYNTFPKQLTDLLITIEKMYEEQFEIKETQWRKHLQEVRMENINLNAQIQQKNKEIQQLRGKLRIEDIKKAQIYINDESMPSQPISIDLLKITQRSQESDGRKSMKLKEKSINISQENTQFWENLFNQIPKRKSKSVVKKNPHEKDTFYSKISQFRKMLFVEKGQSKLGLNFKKARNSKEKYCVYE